MLFDENWFKIEKSYIVVYSHPAHRVLETVVEQKHVKLFLIKTSRYDVWR